MRYYKLLLFFCLSSLLGSSFAQKYSALFIGNSYTGVNNLPNLTAQLATSLGDTLLHSSNTPGGYTLQNHSTNTTTLNSIKQGTWNFVVLQEQSQLPSFPPAQVASDVFPFAKTLVDSIKAANPCTESLFYMTWGKQNGDQQNCANYTPLCTYNGMQDRLRTSYLAMATANNATVSPVGAAWKYTRANYPAINLYNADESHPSLAGSYLAACVFYATMFRKSPEGASYTAGLSVATATTLQTVAQLVVLDSLATWRIGANDVAVNALSYSTLNTSYQFTASTANATSFSWDFGNGTSSSDENPSVTYTTDGTFLVTLNATNECSSDTASTLITVASTGIEEQQPFFNLIQNNTLLQLDFETYNPKNIAIYDLTGSLIQQLNTSSKSHTVELEALPPIFILAVQQGNNQQTIKIIK